MLKIVKPVKTVYFIAYNFDAEGNKHPSAYGIIEPNQHMSTNLENIEEFETYESLKTKLIEYNIQVDFDEEIN